ncbi:MAG TPA: FtsX-like permease family protein [Geopsychrobacteraceae bacterium]|nr:FtsX-like permease family protein [Geopsychrobacteraceae bacterium]
MKWLSECSLVWRLVRRELRGGLRGFGVFLSCLFLGVFAISAIGSFTQAAKTGLLADASALLGGELEVRLNHRQLSEEQQSYLEQYGQTSTIHELRTMAHSFNGEQRALVELKAVDAAYPLYGRLGIEPEQSRADVFGSISSGFSALVEESFLTRIEAEVGDQIRIGTTLFTIRGVLTAEPDRQVRAFTLGPRVMINQPALETTGLIQPGSLITYAYRIKLPDRDTIDQLKETLQTTFPNAGWRLNTWRDAAPRVKFFLDRMNLNLTLVGLCALLVGGLGVSGAVRGYLSGKIFHIATLKSLGASGRTIFATYLIQVLLLGAVGSGAGILCGATLPFLIALALGANIPIPLQPGLYPTALITAAMFGLLIALVFSLKPLGTALQVSPSVLFRGYSDNDQQGPGRRIRVAILIASLALALLAIITSSDKRLALWFICGATVCLAVFRFSAAGIISLARRLPRPASPSLRLGLGNIHRRGSPAASTLFSLGLGLTALVIITLVQANLNDLVNDTIPEGAPAYFFLDIQPDQVADFEKRLRAIDGVRNIERYPTLRGRITAIKGVPVETAKIAPEVRWAVRGDRFLSYAAKTHPETLITAGEWWPTDYQGPPLISLTADLGTGFGVGPGDSLTVNVLGRDITAQIASLREVDWSTLDLNFAVLFAPGVLESAPQTHISAVHVDQEAEETVFKTITGAFPNISAISTREVLSNVSRTLERIGLAFKSMAAITLLTGFLVLAGAVSADQHRRIHDAIIFKVCGATRGDILKSFAAEFTLLGLTAGIISCIVGSLAAYAILEGLMDTSFSLKPGVVLVTLSAGILLTLVLGLAGTWKALGQKPAPYLRAE